MSSNKIFERLQETHLTIPYIYEPKGNHYCVDFLTSWNYLWTTKVQVKTKSCDIVPILITYGDRKPIPYDTININTNEKFSVTGTFGEHTSTDFSLYQLPIDDNGNTIPVIIMSYIRYGSKASFILIHETNQSDVILHLKKYQSDPLICPLFPCLRKKPEKTVLNRQPQSEKIIRSSE